MSPSPSVAATPERGAASRSPNPGARRSCVSSYALDLLSATSGDSPGASPEVGTASPGFNSARPCSWGSPAHSGRALASGLPAPLPGSGCDRVSAAGLQRSPGGASRHGRLLQARLAGAAGATSGGSVAGADLRLSLTGSPLKPAGVPARFDADTSPPGSPQAACKGGGRSGSGQWLQRTHSFVSIRPAAAAAPAEAQFGQEEVAESRASHRSSAGTTPKSAAELLFASEPRRRAREDHKKSARQTLDAGSGAERDPAAAMEGLLGVWSHARQHSQQPAPRLHAGFDQGPCSTTSSAQDSQGAASGPGAGLASGPGQGAEAAAQGPQEAAPGPGARSVAGFGQAGMPAAAQASGHIGFSVHLAARKSLDARPASGAETGVPGIGFSMRPAALESLDAPPAGAEQASAEAAPPAPAGALQNLRSLSRRRQLRALSASLQHVRWPSGVG